MMAFLIYWASSCTNSHQSMYYQYTAPPIWLSEHPHDPRITVGAYTYFDRHLTLGLSTPDERLEIGRFCSQARDVVILAGGEHIMTRATTFPFRWLSAESEIAERYTDATSKGATVIGHDVWVGYGAMILSGVTVGNGAVIGAQAVDESARDDLSLF